VVIPHYFMELVGCSSLPSVNLAADGLFDFKKAVNYSIVALMVIIIKHLDFSFTTKFITNEHWFVYS
jgi:hypothetical protein